MKTYIIKETAIYKIKAHSPEEAEEKFVQSDDVNRFFNGVEEREVYPSPYSVDAE